MKNQLTASPDFQVRPPETDTEMETFFRVDAEVFRPDEDPDLVANQRRRFVTEDPDFHPYQLHGAFLGEKYLGGYTLLERTMCIGPARLRTGCINAVATHPDYRHQGVATALMLDAIDYAQKRQYALLFLHGRPNFYHWFGFIDVLEDTPRCALARQDILELSPGTCLVRPVTLSDAPALLKCYRFHNEPSQVSFAPTRILQRQEHLLRNWFEVSETPSLVALSPEEELVGYLMLSRRWNKLYAYEVAADSWSAALALLHAHSHLLDAEIEPTGQLAWPLPSTDSTFYLLADHLTVCNEMTSSPDQGWMARPVHLPTLFSSLLPLWQEYWYHRPRTLNWTGVLAFTVGDDIRFLEVGPTSLRFVDSSSSALYNVTFSQQVFTQMIFGFRPISWATAQPGQQIPTELIPLLNVLFPLRQAWIAGSDFF